MIKDYLKYLFVFVTAFLLFPMSAFAHEGTVGGFQAGVSHPVLGFDHLLAMVSVGIISAQIGGKAIWAVPLTFVSFMVIGGVLGMIDIGLFAVEIGIALSVVVLGITIASNAKIHAMMIYGFVAMFAIFHGYAHGTEIPELATSWAYILGFVVGTTVLHITGVLIGHFSGKVPNGGVILRHAGSMIAGMGVYILLGMAGII